MVNDPQDDLLDLIRQEFAKALKEKRGGLHIEEDDNPRGDMFKVYALIDGHDLANIGLNKDHDRASCDKCTPAKEEMMKSIYHQDDLRCNEVGLDLKYEAEKFFKSMLDKYPNYNPREMCELCIGNFSLMASRRILDLRHSGTLKQNK